MHLAKGPFSFSEKGASGSWAEPYFLALRYRKARLKNPPGVLMVHGRAKVKEKRTPCRVQYICISVASVGYICRYMIIILTIKCYVT